MAFIVLLVALTFPAVLGERLQPDSPLHVDSYGQLSTDDEAGRLDFFYERLREQPGARGYIIGRNRASVPPGVFLRRLYGDQRYLIEKRGLDPDRISVVEGEYAREFSIDLWMAPNTGPANVSALSTPRPLITQNQLFDDVCLTCEPAVDLDLDGLGEGLRFYGEALQQNLKARAVIVVRPGGYMRTRHVVRSARQAKLALVRDHQIDAARITIYLAPRQKNNLATAEMWIITKSGKQ